MERMLRRPVLSSMHAGFSLGALAGAGAGALAISALGGAHAIVGSVAEALGLAR
ncbi:hypothetical protein [Baekduia soli]|uniref:hypothetical protein n=1 Tax=Baekduia soli TaxID=496014 RepID=UPI00165265DB|nr:hypothetical protein [Baekduia soli]